MVHTTHVQSLLCNWLTSHNYKGAFVSTMTQTEQAVTHVNEALKKEKEKDYATAVDQFEKALKCIERAKKDEKYGETGLGILRQRQDQYTKRLTKLRQKLPLVELIKPPASPVEEECPKPPETVVETHNESTNIYPRLPVDELDAKVPLPGMSGTSPEFSPDKQFLAERNKEPICSSPMDPRIAEDIASMFPGIKPGEADYRHLEEAFSFYRKAEAADKECQLQDALDLYLKAIEFFQLSMRTEISNQTAISRVSKKNDDIEKRVELIQKVVEVMASRQNASILEELGGDHDTIGDQPTLARRQPEGHFYREEIYGLEAARGVLSEAVTRLQSGGKDHYNILLVGAGIVQKEATPFRHFHEYLSPGTGKTALVKSVCEDVPHVGFFYEHGCQADGKIGTIFSEARKHKPSMICIEDIDFLGISSEPVVTKQLLTELKRDSESNAQVILICTASSPWSVDSELRERFDIVVFTPLPDKEERLAIAKGQMLDKIHCLTEDEYRDIADATEGYTGADIVCLMKEAVMATVREIQKATYFKPAPHCQDSHSPDSWIPCNSEDEGAIPMTFQGRLEESLNIHPPEVTYSHVRESFELVQKSLSSSEDFRLRNWVLQTNKSPGNQKALLQRKPDIDKQIGATERTDDPRPKTDLEVEGTQNSSSEDIQPPHGSSSGEFSSKPETSDVVSDELSMPVSQIGLSQSDDDKYTDPRDISPGDIATVTKAEVPGTTGTDYTGKDEVREQIIHRNDVFPGGLPELHKDEYSSETTGNLSTEPELSPASSGAKEVRHEMDKPGLTPIKLPAPSGEITLDHETEEHRDDVPMEDEIPEAGNKPREDCSNQQQENNDERSLATAINAPTEANPLDGDSGTSYSTIEPTDRNKAADAEPDDLLQHGDTGSTVTSDDGEVLKDDWVKVEQKSVEGQEKELVRATPAAPKQEGTLEAVDTKVVHSNDQHQKGTQENAESPSERDITLEDKK